MTTKTWKPDTLAVAAGRPIGPGAPLNQPPVLASTFRYGEDEYARVGTASHRAFETAIGALEGGVAVSFASGMAAAAAVLDTVPVGGTVVTAGNLYHGVRSLLARQTAAGRVVERVVDARDLDVTRAALDGADLLWLETPSNPLIQVLDVEALCGVAATIAVPVVVDSTFATPVLLNPLALGAQYVLHSATKYIGGHSDLLMGVVVTDEPRAQELAGSRTLSGAVPGAMESFLALRGLRTLPLRVRAAQASAGVIAARLAEHPAVTTVCYPGLPGDPGHEIAARQMGGFGAMLSFCVASEELADEVLGRLELVVNATSLGGVETTAERRNRYNEGAPTGLIRLSVGIEDVEDIWSDLDAALRG